MPRLTITFDDNTYNTIVSIAKHEGVSASEIARQAIEKGLSVEWYNKNIDHIAKITREQMDIVIRPHIERLAKLTSKGGHMAATAAFLNVQALQDLVPDQKRDVREMYEKARKKAVEYMKIPVDKFEVFENE
jgi:adenylylsulfate kinase-like enzyme